MSPEDCPPEKKEEWVGLVGGPKKYLADKEKHLSKSLKTIEKLKNNGSAPAAFIADNIFSSEGIFSIPKGYLKDMYNLIRSFSGLAIADEVQSGFGRTGKYMWGFEHDEVVPDIVTLGKPMGNGHPLAAVVTTREIAKSFNLNHGYFNTFGGNPVSAAAGLAVIRFVNNNKLTEHAENVGKHLKKGLNSVTRKLNDIQEVRGSGLFVGIELKSSKAASLAIEGLLSEGILAGQTGPQNNVIKLRPPMTFKKEHADLVIKAIEKVLS